MRGLGQGIRGVLAFLIWSGRRLPSFQLQHGLDVRREIPLASQQPSKQRILAGRRWLGLEPSSLQGFLRGRSEICPAFLKNLEETFGLGVL